jgi:hypothetical protein
VISEVERNQLHILNDLSQLLIGFGEATEKLERVLEPHVVREKDHQRFQKLLHHLPTCAIGEF